MAKNQYILLRQSTIEYNSHGLTFTGLSAADTAAKKLTHAKDLNIDERISLFQNQLKNEYVHRIPLQYLSDIGKINFPTKIDYRTKLFLETKMEKLSESRATIASTAAIPAVDAQIIFTRAPFIQYEQYYQTKMLGSILKL